MWFRVYGGTGAYTSSTSRQLVYTSTTQALAGTLLDNKYISETSTASYNNGWFYSASITPSQGEHVGDKYIFKYVVVGGKNPDTNAFTDTATT